MADTATNAAPTAFDIFSFIAVVIDCLEFDIDSQTISA